MVCHIAAISSAPTIFSRFQCIPISRSVDAVAGSRPLFLIGWLGGPQDYVARHGHPRLRMRHAHVRVDVAMHDAWLRCMRAALDESGVEPSMRAFLEARFAGVADFIRNVEE